MVSEEAYWDGYDDLVPQLLNFQRIGEHREYPLIGRIVRQPGQRNLYTGNEFAHPIVASGFINILGANLLPDEACHCRLDADDHAEEQDRGVQNNSLRGLLRHTEGTAHEYQEFEGEPFHKDHQWQWHTLPQIFA